MTPLRPGRLVPRHALEPLLEAARDSRVIVVNGPRQSGKTTLLHQVHDRIGGRAVSLDDPAELAAARFDPVDYVATADRPMFVDEIQLAGDPLVRAIKTSVDRDLRPGQFFLAGSSQFLTVPLLSESLAGRVHIVDLWPLSQGELQGRVERFIDDLFTGELLDLSDATLRRQDYLDRACAGGFPEVLQRTSDRSRSEWMTDYVRTVVSRDVAEISHARYLDEMPTLIRYLAAVTAQELNTSRLATNTGLGVNTVRRYLPILETTYMMHRLPAWSRNLTAKVTKHPKVFLSDSGLAAHLLGVHAMGLTVPPAPMAGPLLETFVVNEMIKQRVWNETEVRLHHWRDRDGAEVDIVLEANDGRIAGVEVKASTTVTSDDFRHLKAFRDKLGGAFANGVVLYTGTRALRFGERLSALPIGALWERTGRSSQLGRQRP